MNPIASPDDDHSLTVTAVASTRTLRQAILALGLAVILILLSSCSILRARLPVVETTSCLQEIQPFLDSLTTESILPVAEVTIKGSQTPADYLQLFAEIVAAEALSDLGSAHGSPQPALPANQPKGSNLRLVGISPLLGREFIANLSLRETGDIQERILVLAPSRFLSDEHLQEITLLYLLVQQRIKLFNVNLETSKLGTSKLCRRDCGNLSLEFTCSVTPESLSLDFTDSRLRARYSITIGMPSR